MTQAKITISAEDRASRVLQQVRGQMQTTAASANALASSAGLIGPAFATLASAAGLVAFVKGVADVVDQLNDVADATGASIESLSGLERVARLNGGTLGDVSGILIKFNTALSAARDPGSEAARVFQALGLSVKGLTDLDPAAALQRVAVALAGFANDGDKARAVQELFGRSVAQTAPFLNDLAASGKLVATVTREQAEAAERFNKTLFAMQTLAGDAGRSLVLSLGGALSQTAQNAQEAIAAFGGLSGAIKALLAGQTQLKDSPADGLAKYNAELADLDKRIKAIQDGSDGFRGRFADARIEKLQAERAEVSRVADYYRQLLNLGNAGQGRGNAPGPGLPGLRVPGRQAAPGGGKATAVEIDANASALARYVEGLSRQADALDDLSQKQRAVNVLASLGVTGQAPAVRQLVLGLAEELDLREQGLEFAKAMTAELTRQRSEQEALDEALNRFSGRTADALKRAQVARLEGRLQAGEAFSPEELDRIVRGIGGIEVAARDTFDAADKSLTRFAENVQDAMGATVEATLRGDFDSIGRLWADLLLKMAAQAVAADLSSALFGDLKKTGATAGGGSLLGGLFGGLFSLGTGRATGGTVNPMSLQRVNESGFEMFRQGGQDWLLAGPQGGKVLPAGEVSGGALVVNNYNTFAAGVSRNEMAAFGQAIKAQTLQAVAESRRRGRAS